MDRNAKIVAGVIATCITLLLIAVQMGGAPEDPHFARTLFSVFTRLASSPAPKNHQSEVSEAIRNLPDNCRLLRMNLDLKPISEMTTRDLRLLNTCSTFGH